MGGVEGLMCMKTKTTPISIAMKLHSNDIQHDHNFHYKQSGEWFTTCLELDYLLQ